MLSNNVKKHIKYDLLGVESFDIERLEEIANDVKRNYFPNSAYSDFERKVWEIMDGVLESGYDMGRKLHCDKI